VSQNFLGTSATPGSSAGGGGGAAAEGEDLWNRALSLESSGRLEQAFSLVLDSGDTFLLVRFMGRTGPGPLGGGSGSGKECLLSHALASRLLAEFTQFLRAGHFLDTLFPWVCAAIDLSSRQLQQQVPALVGREESSALSGILHELAAAPTHQGIAAAKLFAQLQKSPMMSLS
jgi:hypothetical protein